MFLFLQAFGFAFYKTQQSDKASLSYPNGKWVNIEAHSIAFSALLLWLVPAVYFGSIIGVSQVDEELPSKLNAFRQQLLDLQRQSQIKIEGHRERTELERQFSLGSSQLSTELRTRISGRLTELSTQFEKLPNFPVFSSSEIPGYIPLEKPAGQPKLDYTDRFAYLSTRMRIKSGGIYSCRARLFANRNPFPHQVQLGLGTIIACHVVAFGLVASSVGISLSISWRVPPVRNKCRLLAEAGALAVWIASYLMNFAIFRWAPDRWHYGLTYAKDVLSSCAIFVMIVVTQVGIFNRCSCYIQSDGSIANPLVQAVGQLLDKRFMEEWLPVVMFGITFQLTAGLILSWWYIVAFRVFLQRSDDRSNLDQVLLIGGLLKKTFNELERMRFFVSRSICWLAMASIGRTRKRKDQNRESGATASREEGEGELPITRIQEYADLKQPYL